MKNLADAREKARQSLRGKLAEYLVAGPQARFELSVGRLTEKAALQDPTATAQLIGEYRAAGQLPGLEIQWQSVSWRVTGQQTLPLSLSVTGLEYLADFAGQRPQIDLLRRRWEELGAATAAAGAGSAEPQAGPVAAQVIAAYQKTLLELPEDDWQRTLSVASWLFHHPDSGSLPRSLPIAGIDTKWLESHQRMVAGILQAWRALYQRPGGTDFGLAAPKTTAFDVFFADPALAPRTAGGRCLRSLSLPVPDLIHLFDEGGRPAQIIILENQESFLSCEDAPATVYIWGAGDRVSALGRCPWMRQIPVYYWGDLDSHGFRLLAKLRKAIAEQAEQTEQPTVPYTGPVTSLLMDQATWSEHRQLAVPEPTPAPGDFTAYLTIAEQEMLQILRDFPNGRLEQERIAWPWAQAVLQQHTQSVLTAATACASNE